MPIVDKAHNPYLDILVSYGAFSVLVWIALFAVPILRLWRSRQALPFGLAWALIGLQVYFLAWFPSITNEVYFVILLAIAWALMARSHSPASHLRQPPVPALEANVAGDVTP